MHEDIKVGDVIYKYTMSHRDLKMHKGVVEKLGEYLVVEYETAYGRDRVERIPEFGVIVPKHRCIWLKERDDALAKQEFTRHVKERIYSSRLQIRMDEAMLEIIEEIDFAE